MKKPRILSPKELDELDHLSDLPGYSPELLNSWSQVLGIDWLRGTDEECYGNYLIWYHKNFTKIGEALYG